MVTYRWHKSFWPLVVFGNVLFYDANLSMQQQTVSYIAQHEKNHNNVLTRPSFTDPFQGNIGKPIPLKKIPDFCHSNRCDKILDIFFEMSNTASRRLLQSMDHSSKLCIYGLWVFSTASQTAWNSLSDPVHNVNVTDSDAWWKRFCGHGV